VADVNKAFYEKEEAFFTIKAKEKEEIIHNVCNQLMQRGFIEENAIQSILDREKISSTEIGNLVVILENPIIWDKQEVQLIFMVFFNPKEKHNFSIFKYLYTFIKDEGGVRGIIKICDFNKLMKLIED
jgi:mannitol/fructose-specific phosphotransferase system IIA component (Ntr-type)